jgi:tetratricopeptide (TPR) repeat protein
MSSIGRPRAFPPAQSPLRFLLGGLILAMLVAPGHLRAQEPGAGAKAAPAGQAEAAEAAALVRAALAALDRGRLDEAEQLVGDLPAGDHGAGLVRARLARIRGHLDDAETRLRPLAAAEPLGAAALELGLLLLDRGRQADAEAVLQPFVAGAAEFERGEDLIRAARAAHALGHFRLANSLYREAAASLPGSAVVNTAWGDLLREKHNLPEAVKSYRLALEADSDHAPAHLGLALALSDDNPPAARQAAERALALNPTLWDAALALAALDLSAGQREEAGRRVAAVLSQNPSVPAAHALSAAIAWLADDQAGYEQAVRRALAINPSWGEVYRVVAEYAADHYRFEEAAALARRAVALDERNALAWADLGKHLLRTGDEAEARTALDRAFDLDPFNQITFNLLGMLDTLDTFEVVEADNLIVKLHPDEAPVMRRQVVPLAAEALAALSARYGLVPRGPILVEMFPRHDDFAVRNVGLPGMIGALGACFGRVVTLDSPKARPPGSFNWAATLWHELAHVVTLQLSRQRVPRWLTEGISVYEERQARPWWGRESDLLFVQALAEGRVVPLAALNAAFTDPRRISLAYHQASLVVEHLVARFGPEVLSRMLKAYGEGLGDEAVLRQAAGVEPDDLQRSFDRFIEERFGAQRRTLVTPEGLDEAAARGDIDALRALAASHPESFAVHVALGRALAAGGATLAARAAFDRAAALLPAAAGADSPYVELAKAAEQAGQAALAREALERAMATHPTALDLARRLFELAAASGDEPRLEMAARRMAEVDPFDAAAHGALGRLALARGSPAEAVERFRTALLASPADPVSAHTDLAEALLAAGEADDAKREAIAALEQAPRYVRAQEILLRVVDGPVPRRP